MSAAPDSRSPGPLSTGHKILFVGEDVPRESAVLSQLAEAGEVVTESSTLKALALLTQQKFDGIYVTAARQQDVTQLGNLLQNDRILQSLPDAVLLVDANQVINWGNGRLRQWFHSESLVGHNLYQVIGSPEVLGPDFSTHFSPGSMACGATVRTIRSRDNRYFEVHTMPVQDATDTAVNQFLVVLRDVTQAVQQRQKLEAIHRAGAELSNLTAMDLRDISEADRVELLKQNILQNTKDLLNFDVVEIRTLDRATLRLKPLLSVGMNKEAAERELFAQPERNGVTGYVAANGKSYICENTERDPHYLEGISGGKSSLTVPLVLNDQVVGTFNVESPEPRAFTDDHRQFLEIFARDIARALNTLDLLAAERATTTVQSVEAIHKSVALPVDEILNLTVQVMERYRGHDPVGVEQLLRVVSYAREIKCVITDVGRQLAPATALPVCGSAHPKLFGRHILVVDSEDEVRTSAHHLLEPFGCFVETAHDGFGAISLVRGQPPGFRYDAIVADIRLPDLKGMDLMNRLLEVLEPLPLVFVVGYGYDAGHTVVKARQAGVQRFISKPLQLAKLVEALEFVISPPPAKTPPTSGPIA